VRGHRGEGAVSPSRGKKGSRGARGNEAKTGSPGASAPTSLKQILIEKLGSEKEKKKDIRRSDEGKSYHMNQEQ